MECIWNYLTEKVSRVLGSPNKVISLEGTVMEAPFCTIWNPTLNMFKTSFHYQADPCKIQKMSLSTFWKYSCFPLSSNWILKVESGKAGKWKVILLSESRKVESDPAFRKLESWTRKVCFILRLYIKHTFRVQLSNFQKAGKWKVILLSESLKVGP